MPKRLVMRVKKRRGQVVRKTRPRYRKGRTAPSKRLLSYKTGTRPFPPVMPCVLTYQGEFGDSISSGAAAVAYTQWRPNDLYDFDVSGNFGNKQPLYYDQLLSATGPYKRYMVYAWKTTLTIFNTSDIPLEIFVDTNTMNSLTDADTVTEIANRRGVIKRLITAQANAKPYTTISWFKNLNSIVPGARASINEWGGYYTGSPNNYIANTLLVRSITQVAGFTFRCKVNHQFYVKLFETDATVS